MHQSKPRNPNRIPEVLKSLQEIWEKHPDMRLTQLIGNVFHGDNYYVEDETLVNGVKEFYGASGSKQDPSTD